MENLIYPDGLVVIHNGPVTSVASGGGTMDNMIITPRIEYDPGDHLVKVYAELITTEDAVSVTWSHSVVFMGPPIESVSVRFDGIARDYFYVTPNILLKGGPGITTEVPFYQVPDMFTGKTECLEVEFALHTSKPYGLPVRGELYIDCKMPDWVIPH